MSRLPTGKCSRIGYCRMKTRRAQMETKTSDIYDIVSSLLTCDPYRIVLFGSHALGTEETGSDIDLLVILDSEVISQTYEERMQRRLVVRKRIEAINRLVPIDLIVYTKAEYELLQRHGTSFLNEIESLGKILYEKAS
ncbi:MAG: nucleotidyltransferase domain-containing protein [Gemmatimonadetes bacterium]|nr:nucleotidyltransferase domain-containing protein [Gemmatimonadota bacterium]MYI62791.1 nucleotidyltransferase domain-containing protein [Gemmatimonadota bacterium]